MEFITKIDLTSRQAKQYPTTNLILSGATSFGVPFSALTTGPDLNTSGITSTQTNVISTFSGNSGTTIYSWGNSTMNLGNTELSAITMANSGTTQIAGPIFTSNTTTVIDGNSVTLTYSGVTFDITPTSFIDLGGGAYSGSMTTDVLIHLSAGTLDFTGRTIWVDVNGITRSERIIITNVDSGPGIIDIGVDANGFIVNQASDLNLKENITPITNALEKVLSLNGVTYNWKDRERGGNELKMGLIAQDVNNVVPELAYIGPNGLMGVHYKDIPALLIEAIKELANNGGIKLNNVIKTQTIVAEDNNIELNFNGSHISANGGGLIVIKGVDEKTNSELKINSDGDWVTNNSIIPKQLILPEYTPKASNDAYGVKGSIVTDNDYIYIKGSTMWKRIKLENF